MTNLCTKVTVRQRPIKNGQISLYLDFYPPIRHPKTGRLTRREYLGLYIYAKPTEQFEKEYNLSILKKAEIIKCRRSESIINEEFGFIDHSQGKESFLKFFTDQASVTGHNKWMPAVTHFSNYTKGACRFIDLNIPLCQGFADYLLTVPCKGGKQKGMQANSANNMLNKLKACLHIAYDQGLIKDNIGSKIHHVKEHNTPREFLSHDELIRLSNTPCESDVLRSASLFSCLTGLRLSDIQRLKWENIQKSADGGWCLCLVTKKTGADANLPISDETLALCGERKEPTTIVFPKFGQNMCQKYLKDWLKSAKITKKITFHCFRHTYATLQLAAGTDLYTISKMLTHSNIGVTQVYADVVSDLKRDAANRISLKDDKKDKDNGNINDNDNNNDSNSKNNNKENDNE